MNLSFFNIFEDDQKKRAPENLPTVSKDLGDRKYDTSIVSIESLKSAQSQFSSRSDLSQRDGREAMMLIDISNTIKAKMTNLIERIDNICNDMNLIDEEFSIICREIELLNKRKVLLYAKYSNMLHIMETNQQELQVLKKIIESSTSSQKPKDDKIIVSDLLGNCVEIKISEKPFIKFVDEIMNAYKTERMPIRFQNIKLIIAGKRYDKITHPYITKKMVIDSLICGKIYLLFDI